MDDTFKTISKPVQGYFKDKGSKFISLAFPVTTENEIKEILQQIRKEHHGARHVCYAWRLGEENIRYRANDDGEPSSTAGKPILGQLQGYDVTNVLLAVVRYFGGTLLGVGGLIQAYKNAASNALEQADIITEIIERRYRLFFPYTVLSEVMRMIRQENLHIISSRFEDQCTITFSVRKAESEKVEKIFSNFYSVRFEPSVNISDNQVF